MASCPSVDRLEKRDVERGSARRSSLARGRDRANSNQTNIEMCHRQRWAKTSEIRGGAHMGFSVRINTTLNWTKLNWTDLIGTERNWEKNKIPGSRRSTESQLYSRSANSKAKKTEALIAVGPQQSLCGVPLRRVPPEGNQHEEHEELIWKQLGR